MTLTSLILTLAACSGGHATDDSGSADDTGASSVACEDGVCVVSGTITEDLTMTADNAWLLRGGVFIGDDESETVLTIQAGTTIYGESSTDGMLVITRGSRIMAEGTADAPIVFTSSKAEGSRARGDWGGLVINGKARINACADDGASVCEAYGEGGTGWYGGDDDTDSSGVLEYLRVEFAGTLVSPDNELNGIAFQGVGSGTELDYLQVHYNADDGIEFFGGTAQAKHLLVTGVGDDSLDWTDGWRGKAQFVILQQAEDASDNGIEADNNGDANDAEPRSFPTLSNLTIVGVADSSNSDIGMLLREGTAGDISNVIVTDFNDACLSVDHDATVGQIDSGELTLTHTMLNCSTPFVTQLDVDGDEEADTWVVEDFFTAGSGNVQADPLLDGWVPASGSPALGAGSAPADAFFDSVDFVGAIGDTDWTAGWTTTDPS